MGRPKGKKTEYKGYIGILTREVRRLKTVKSSLTKRIISIDKEISRIQSFLNMKEKQL